MRVRDVAVRLFHSRSRDRGFVFQDGRCVVLFSKPLHITLFCDDFNIWHVVHHPPVQAIPIWLERKQFICSADIDHYKQMIGADWSARNYEIVFLGHGRLSRTRIGSKQKNRITSFNWLPHHFPSTEVNSYCLGNCMIDVTLNGLQWVEFANMLGKIHNYTAMAILVRLFHSFLP